MSFSWRRHVVPCFSTRMLIAICLVLSILRTTRAETRAPSVRELIQQLKSKDLIKQLDAVEQLGRRGPEAREAAPALATAFENWKLRRRAGYALVRIGAPAVPALLGTLRSKNDRRRPLAVKEVVIQIGAPAVPELIRALSSGHTAVRNAAIEVLEEIGPEADEAVPALLRVLRFPRIRIRFPRTTGEDISIDRDADGSSERAIAALASMGPNGIRALSDMYERPSSLPLLSWCFAGPQIAWGLVRQSDAEDKEEVPAADSWPIFLLGRWRVQQWQLLKREFRNSPLFDRRAAVMGMRRVATSDLPGRSAKVLLNALVRALHDDDLEIRVDALEALEAFGPLAASAAREVARLLTDCGYLEETSRSAQLCAVHALKELGPEGRKLLQDRGLPVLLDSLNDKNYHVRRYAVEGLRLMGGAARPAVPKLLQMLSAPPFKADDDERAYVAEGILMTIAQLGEKPPAAVLRLLKDSAAKNRARAVFWLGCMRKNAFPSLSAMTAALRDQDAEVRQQAVFALALLGRWARPALPALEKALAETNGPERLFDERILVQTMLQIDRRSYTRIVQAKKAHPLPPDLLRRLGTGDRAAVPQLFEQLKRGYTAIAVPLVRIDPGQTKAVLGVLMTIPTQGVQSNASLVYFQIKPDDPANLVRFEEQLRGDYLGRRPIDNIIRDMGERARPAIPLFCRLLAVEDRMTNAAKCLAALAPHAAEAIPALRAAFHVAPDDRSKSAVIDALIRLDSPKHVFDLLLPLLRDPRDPDRPLACVGLAKLGTHARGAQRRLRELLAERQGRVVAAEALIRIVGPEHETIQILNAALRHPGELGTALQAIRRLGPLAEDTVGALSKLLEEGSDWDKTAVLEVLASLGRVGKKAEPAILRCLNDKFPWARKSAATALGALGGESAIPPLCVVVEEDEDAVAEAAEAALHRIRARVKRRE